MSGDNDILEILKIDLQISSSKYDTYLKKLISMAKSAIEKEGIYIANVCTENEMLVEMYAAYLYRKRRGESAEMPRSLRYMLNNKLMRQKAGNLHG